LWEELQQADSKHIKEVLGKVPNGNKETSKADVKRKKKQTKVANVLASIFGKQQTRKIMHGARTDFGGDNDAAARIKEAAQESVRKLKKKQTVVETRKFAGEVITYVFSTLYCVLSTFNDFS
jgi:hypothetical protein